MNHNYVPRQRSAVDGKIWWCVFDTTTNSIEGIYKTSFDIFLLLKTKLEPFEELLNEKNIAIEYLNSNPDSYYVIGSSYQIQTNLRVREGPGKEYRILNRDELSPNDYENSVDSKTTTDALMEEGKTVICLGMEGDWMRIESGWICVYDEGEILVR